MAIYQYGIDVSRYQGDVNWSQVAAAGKRFAIVRVGSSNGNGLYIDPYFEKNVNGAHAAGLRVGAYYYTYATSETAVARELNTFLPALEGLQLEYPVYVDVEASTLTGVGRTALTNLVKYAMDIIDEKGYFPGWYTYTSFAQNYINPAALSAYPFWIADFRGYVGYTSSYQIWQYSSTGNVNGVTGNVDLDYSYKDYLPEIIAAGKNGYSASGAPVMEQITGKSIQVFGSNTEYFYNANVNDIVGYLPIGTYPVTAKSEEPYGGFDWVTFQYQGGLYWTALLEDRMTLIDTPSDELTECQTEVSTLKAKIAAAKAALE